MAQYHRNRAIEIILIDSSSIGTVGVGEASIPNILNFNDYVGLGQRDFVQGCHGSFKLGIRFDDWKTKGSSFFHPFGQYGVPLQGMEFHQCLHRARAKGHSFSDIADFSLPAGLARKGRFSQPARENTSPLNEFGYAFHFNAAEYAAQLKQIAIQGGISHIDGRITSVAIGEDGMITSVKLKSGEVIAGDMFIDCSGFRALLIGDALETPYESWQRWLPCDRAVAIPSMSNEGSVASYTTATALPYGWSWAIPLQNRLGNGYVYSSEYLTESQAETDLRTRLGATASGDANHQKFRAGMRENFWVRNCVALGLAGGFIEPLESTSINLVHRALSVLMDYFPDVSFDPRKIRQANRIFRKEQENIRDFIILHYWASRRIDTPFWRDVSGMAIPQTLEDKVEAYRSSGHLLQYEAESFKQESWLTMYEGFGIYPDTYDIRADDIDLNYILRSTEDMKLSIQQVSEKAPLHGEFIDSNCPSPS